MKCPSCRAENQTGKYCAECGSALRTTCAACDATVPPGSRFCPSCGEPVAAGAQGGGVPRAAWVIVAAALTVVLLIVFLPRQTDRVTAPPAHQSRIPLGQGGGGSGGGMSALSPDMRTNADRLFQRIMTAAEEGNRAEVERFMPMAVQAYGMVDDLDDDGIYHLAILHQTAGEYDEARATAQRILDRAPNHILALGVAASSAQAAGDTATANDLWQRLLDAYPDEVGKSLPEYTDHRAMLEEYRALAGEAAAAH